MASKALSDGAIYKGTSIYWAAAGDCARPYVVSFVTQLDEPVRWSFTYDQCIADHPDGTFSVQTQPIGSLKRDLFDNSIDRYKARYLDIEVRCRKCQWCLQQRSRLWAARAFTECQIADRTWFATFTVAPEHRVRVNILSRRATGVEDFAGRYRTLSKWFTLYLKRVRKQSGCKFRYLLAAERHQDGFPHLHALFHEVDGRIPKRLWQKEWKYGFSSLKLADPLSARYVTKYIAKQVDARVRASLHYGAASAIVTTTGLLPEEEERVFPDPSSYIEKEEA